MMQNIFTKIIFIGLSLLFGGFISMQAVADQQPGKAVLLDINTAIGPAVQDYFHRGLEKALQDHAKLVILRIDTPGGLDKSMREIVKDIAASSVPVVSYVAPEGARAASAGTFILYASQIAAMAPATNLGAATPVNLGGGFPSLPGDKNSDQNKVQSKQDEYERKVTNDAVAYIRSLAELNGRNAAWGEKAIREGASLSAEEALNLKVIDLIAKDIPDLLQKIDGRIVIIQGVPQQLHTKGLNVETISADWRAKLLAVITDPSVAYILLLLGAYGLFFEFVNPGFVLPGVVGAIALFLALYALQLLPINYAGLGLILLGIIFMGLEAVIPSGALGIGGLIAFVAGSILLLDVGGAWGIPGLLIFTMTAITAVFFTLLVLLVVRSRHRKVVSGREDLFGSQAEVREDFQQEGWVNLKGETWWAHSKVPLYQGQLVKVVGINGLVLTVEPYKK